MPSMLGGGDLDGDTYSLIPLDLHPNLRPTSTVPPADYLGPQRKLVEHDCTLDDVAEFIIEYIHSDVSLLCSFNSFDLICSCSSACWSHRYKMVDPCRSKSRRDLSPRLWETRRTSQRCGRLSQNRLCNLFSSYTCTTSSLTSYVTSPSTQKPCQNCTLIRNQTGTHRRT